MKIDLEDLERQTRGRGGCPDLDPMWPTPTGPRGPVMCVLYPSCRCGAEDAKIAASVATRPVMLALIARIRELEAAFGEAAGSFESASSSRSRSEYADGMRALINKGVVIP